MTIRDRIDKLQVAIEKVIEDSGASHAEKGIALNHAITEHILRSNNGSLKIADMILTLFKELTIAELKEKGWK